jgi:serine kinase of HPr protein (carbohydrate metabolism regulator)
MSTLIHATCVAIGARAVLIVGVSGAGKSDLALRLIDRGAVLVSDDQVLLDARSGMLLAQAPATIAGKIEVRALGIQSMKHCSPMPVSLLIDLVPPIERMPDPRHRTLCGIDVPLVALDPFEGSAPIKVELALRELGLTL